MTSEVAAIASGWLKRLNAALGDGDVSGVANLFADECYWRDLIALTWNIRTVEGRSAIAEMLAATLPATRPGSFALEGAADQTGNIIEAWFKFETALGRGSGHLRLKDGLGYTLLTSMDVLICH